MAKVLKSYTSNYKISVKDEGTITLDTGNAVGTVIVTGNLEVLGDTTTINTADLTIEDNIIVLSDGTQGSGLPSSVNFQSGIQIDRGSLPDARWIFDEQISWTLGGLSGQGTFYAEQGQGGQKLPINTPGIVAQGNFYVDTGNGVISVTNTPDYEEKIFNYNNGEIAPDSNGLIVIDDDTIPNTKAVKDFVDFTFTNRASAFIAEGNTRVEAVDESHPLFDVVSVNDGGNDTTVIQTRGQHGFTESDSVDIIGIEANGDPIENLNGLGIAVIEVINANLLRLDVSVTGGDVSSYIEDSGTIRKTGFAESRVKIDVQGVNIADFFDNRFNIDGIEISDNTIKTITSNEDLVLKAPGSGTVKIDDVIELPSSPYDDDPTLDPASPQSGVRIYTKSQSTGKTGLYYVNNSNTRDEIISKNRSLLFSMLF